jgi:hypothetical protein
MFYSPVYDLIYNFIKIISLACVKYIASVHPEPESNSNSHILKKYKAFYKLTLIISLSRFELLTLRLSSVHSTPKL